MKKKLQTSEWCFNSWLIIDSLKTQSFHIFLSDCKGNLPTSSKSNIYPEIELSISVRLIAYITLRYIEVTHTSHIYKIYIYMCMLWAQTSRTECTQCTPCMHTLYVYCIAHTVRTVSYTLYALYVHTVRAVCTHCMQMLYAHVWVSTKWPLQDNLCYVILICGHCTAITGQSVSCNALLQDTWACTYNVCSVWIRMCAVCACIYVERAHTHVCSVCIHIVCSVCIHVCVRALSAFYVYMCAENMCNLYMQCMHMFACTL